MARVTHVCLSDLHLGEEDSVLSNVNDNGCEGDPSKPGPVLEQLSLCIKDLADKLWKGKRPALVLNGDALELALCPLHRASMAFQCFINQFKIDNKFMFSKILLLPGNHDHHLWVMTREAQYRDYLLRHMHDQEVVGLPPIWHHTKLFSAPGDPPVINHFLSDLIHRPPVGLDVKVQVAYPNLGIMRDDDLHARRAPEKCVVFHHGHFTEWIYNAVSVVNDWIFGDGKPHARHAWKVERENFAWIDFAWSALGQSWDSGQGLETVYEKALDNKKFGEIIAKLASGVTGQANKSWLGRIEAGILDEILEWAFRSFAGTEKGHAESRLSPSGVTQLAQYVQGPLHAHICHDLLALQLGKNSLDEQVYTADFFKNANAPRTTFVCGHTHKPYASFEDFRRYSGGVDVYNSGGWVVETLKYAPLHGGSVVLVDEELNVASIRMYNENADDIPLPVRLEPPPNSLPPNPLAQEIAGFGLAGTDPWKTFSLTVAAAVGARRKHLRERVESRLSD